MGFIRRWFNQMFSVKDIEEALGVKIATTDEMIRLQELWRNVFNGNAPWNTPKVKSTKVAKSVCKKVAKLVTLNLQSEITGSPTAEWLNEQFKRVVTVSGKNGFRTTVEKGNKNGTLIGRVFLRDFVYKETGFNEGNLYVDFFEPDMFYPIAFDENGNLIDSAYLYIKQIGDKKYKLLERITYTKNTKTLSINYRVFVSEDNKTLGRKARLSDVPDWANLQELYEHYDVEKPWHATFVMPELGTEENRSPMGSSLFTNAINTLQKIDEIEELTDHEFKAGRLKQNISSDMLKKGDRGNWGVDEDVFMVFDGTGIPGDGYINTYNPPFRNESLKDRKNDLKRDVETEIGIAHGTISDVNEVAKTATEVNHGREDTGSTVKEIQDTWEPVLKDIIDIMYDMGVRYDLCDEGEYTSSFWWNDSIVVTQEEKQAMFDAELKRMKDLYSIGIVKKEELRAFFVENSDYFSKISPEALKEAMEMLSENEEEQDLADE